MNYVDSIQFGFFVHFGIVRGLLYMTIQILPDSIVDQINAGEVIESPVSVVKELVENSIDAGSTNIYIEIQGGGLSSIVVHDNGKGMDAVNARLCFLRHATSKLRSEKDLWRLTTLGFRGEALSSIAACSKFTIKTAKKGSIEGIELQIAGGKVVKEQPCAFKEGTRVEVKSLFYNVPARQKFQKSASTYTSQIVKLLQGLSLLHINKGFTLVSQCKTLLQLDPCLDNTSASAYRKRAKDVLKSKFFEPMIWVDAQDDHYTFKGLIADPAYCQKSRSYQFLFINDRLVFSYEVSRAIQEGYGTRIQERSYPPFILFLYLPKEEVDVNVHPQKREIRLENTDRLIRNIRATIDQTLSKSAEPEFIIEAESLQPSKIQSSFFPKTFCENRFNPAQNLIEQTISYMPKVSASAIGLIGKYLLLSIEAEEGVCRRIQVLDLLAAYARCLFESFFMKQKTFSAQKLLFPLTIKLSDTDFQKAEHAIELFQKTGVDIRIMSENVVAIEALPSFIAAEDFTEFFTVVLEDLTDSSFSSSLKKKIEGKWARSSVAIAAKYKRSWSLAEAKKVHMTLKECADQNYDPTGNPIYFELTSDQLDRLRI